MSADPKQMTDGAQEYPGRPPQPDEVVPAYVFFASELSSYSTGEALGALGGETHPG